MVDDRLNGGLVVFVVVTLSLMNVMVGLQCPSNPALNQLDRGYDAPTPSRQGESLKNPERGIPIGLFVQRLKIYWSFFLVFKGLTGSALHAQPPHPNPSSQY